MLKPNASLRTICFSISLEFQSDITGAGNTQSDPAHEGEVIRTTRCNNIVNCIVEDRNRTCCCIRYPSLSFHVRTSVPVTPTITSGCAAKIEKTTEPSTEARRTSLTPKLIFVFVNMSSEKARAGNILN